MTVFLQLHALTVYSAAALNRDSAGRPKTMIYGGAERLRISSQALKRAVRTSPLFLEAVGAAVGVRSRRLAAGLVAALAAAGLDPAEATRRVSAVIAHDRLGKTGGDAAATEQLVHLGPDEIARLEGLRDRLLAGEALEQRAPLVLAPQPRAADIALFGRMLADNPVHAVEAAVQVAHAFTTHRAQIEDDFFTAVDDLAGGAAGAAFAGVHQFGGGVFYLYLCIDTAQLRANLAGDGALAGAAVEGLIRAVLADGPRGGRGAFASRAKASYALLEAGEEFPRSLAAAFQRPVGEQPAEADLLRASVARLKAQRQAFLDVYDEAIADTRELWVGEPASASAADLCALARRHLEAGSPR